jgi:NADPH:quinone reductase-like Zn-dependent oxidoreductase
MQAIVLVKYGNPERAFELRELNKPEPKEGEIRIKVDAFGLNYADVMARKGLYKDAPALPSVIGYDVVGIVDKLGPGADEELLGKRVIALTRFGGYAEYVVANQLVAHPITDDLSNAAATALATQYSTAYYASTMATNIFEGDHVLIHAAAGGVGLALIQLAKLKNCVIYATASSDMKIKMLEDMGVNYPINSEEIDFVEEVENIRGSDGLDMIFDSIGGNSVKKGFKLLSPGGRIVCYGGSKRGDGKGIINDLRLAIGFGIYSPISFLTQSKSFIGVNMLRISDERPSIIKEAMEQVISLVNNKVIQEPIGRAFPVSDISEAHNLLESRESVGKLAIEWK